MYMKHTLRLTQQEDEGQACPLHPVAGTRDASVGALFADLLGPSCTLSKP